MAKRFAVFFLALTVASVAFVAAPKRAEAQESTFVDMTGRPFASPQGLIGTALLGAEAVILIEGAVGVRSPLILLGTGALGLIAGGIGGFFIDQAIDSANSRTLPMVSSGLLVAGLGLIIPTAIMYLSATMYHPEDTQVETEDNAGGNAPLEESVGGQQPGQGAAPTGGSQGGAAGGTTPNSPSDTQSGGGGAGRTPRRHIGPEALINYRNGGLHLGVPTVSLVPSYTAQEVRQFGVAQQNEWRVPVISGSF